MKIYSVYFLALLAVIIAVTASCKKTVGLTPLPQDKVLEYQVVNIPDTIIYGAVDNIENTITVYVPFYYSLNVIQPQITLDQGAKLSEQAVPVSITDSAQTYTVIGSDGSSRTYKLIIVQQNPLDLSVDWNGGVPASTGYPYYPMPIIGNFESLSPATLKVTLTSQTTGEVLTPDESSVTITADASGSYVLPINVPADADSGYYNVEVQFLGNTATMTTPLHVIYQVPQVLGGQQEAKAGGNITLITPANNGHVLLGLTSVSVTLNSITYNFPVVSTNRTSAVLTIPANFPVGTWGNTPFTFTYSGWPTPVTQNILLVVDPQ